MKKNRVLHILIVAIMVLSVICFVGCKKKVDVTTLDPDEAILGKWHSDVMYKDNGSMQANLKTDLVINEDKTGVITLDGTDCEITWEFKELSEEVLVYNFHADETVTYIAGIQYEDDATKPTLAMVVGDDIMIVFER